MPGRVSPGSLGSAPLAQALEAAEAANGGACSAPPSPEGVLLGLGRGAAAFVTSVLRCAGNRAISCEQWRKHFDWGVVASILPTRCLLCISTAEAQAAGPAPPAAAPHSRPPPPPPPAAQRRAFSGVSAVRQMLRAHRRIGESCPAPAVPGLTRTALHSDFGAREVPVSRGRPRQGRARPGRGGGGRIRPDHHGRHRASCEHRSRWGSAAGQNRYRGGTRAGCEGQAGGGQ